MEVSLFWAIFAFLFLNIKTFAHLKVACNCWFPLQDARFPHGERWASSFKENLPLASLIRRSKRSSCTYSIDLKLTTTSNVLPRCQFIYFPIVQKRAVSKSIIDFETAPPAHCIISFIFFSFIYFDSEKWTQHADPTEILLFWLYTVRATKEKS